MPDGTPVEQYTLERDGLSCDILTYGGILRALRVPDRNGQPVDVLLGYDRLEDYRADTSTYLGALVGRCANRIGKAEFTLDGVTYPIAANNGVNHLHGGIVGFNSKVWSVTEADENSLTLTLTSPDMEEGYPGTLQVSACYRLEHGALSLSLHAVCDRNTLCNLTNHSYFNLSGHSSGPITGQQIQIFADAYTPTDSGLIPTGEIAPVEGTPMDLRESTVIGDHIDDPFLPLQMAGGYDHNYVLRGAPGTLRPAARAYSPETGIVLEEETTQPGLQFYAGNSLTGSIPGKGGAPNARRWGFCLETQTYPDAIHHENFPSPILTPGTVYDHKTVYRFSVMP